jgi:hypothetical protein
MIFMCVVTTPAIAQARLAVDAGIHYTTVDYDLDLENFFSGPGTTWENGWRATFTGGASVEFPLGQHWAVSPGLRYVQRGNNFRLDAGSIVNEGHLVQNYLALPVILHVRPFSTDRIALQAGPEIAFLLSAWSAVDAKGSGLGAFRTDTDAIKNVDVSLEGGVEYAFPMENHEGFVRLRYSYGVTGVAEPGQWISDWSSRGVESTFGLRW